VCARPIDVVTGGRPRRYCSDACKSVAYRRRTRGHKTRGLITLTQGDAVAVLGGMASESVDLVAADPPYQFARGSTYFRTWFAMLPDSAWPGVCGELHRVLRPDRHAYLVCDRRSHPVFLSAAKDAGFRIAATLVWDKMSPGLGRGAYRAQHELVLLLKKGHRESNRRDLGDVLRFPRVARGYPTEKPVGLWKILIGQSTQAGELVLDPFCGSGSVGAAARELGRRAVLCDIDAATAAARLRVAVVVLDGAADVTKGRNASGAIRGAKVA